MMNNSKDENKKMRAFRKDCKNSEKIKEYEMLFNGLCRELNRRYGKDYQFDFEKWENCNGISFDLTVKASSEEYKSYLRMVYECNPSDSYSKVCTWSMLTAYKRLFESIFSGKPLGMCSTVSDLVNEKGLNWKTTLLEPVERTSIHKEVTIVFPKYSSIAECFMGMSLMGWNLLEEEKNDEEDKKNSN